MAKEATPRGSIIYKILIVLLSVALIYTIIFPRQLWEEEEERTQICRNNMQHILYAEYIYLSEHNAFNDTLSKVVEFIKSDTTGELLRTFTNSDSILAFNIIDYLKSDDVAFAIIDSLQRYGRRFDIDTTDAMILDSLRTYSHLVGPIDSMALSTLVTMATCPTTYEPYIIEVNNDSTIKLVSLIACPIDAEDSIKVAQDFKLSKLGGLKIENHGQIENGDIKW